MRTTATIRPAPTDDFTYTLTPGGSTATVRVTVTCVDDAPVAVDDTATVSRGQRRHGDRRARPTTPTSTAGPKSHRVGHAAGQRHGGDHRRRHRPDLHAERELLQQPARDDADNFTYTLTPGGSTGDGRDDRDLRRRQSGGGRRQRPRWPRTAARNAVDVLANDTDPDGGPISVASVTQPANGTVVNNGDRRSPTRRTRTTATTRRERPDTFTYTLTPGGSIGDGVGHRDLRRRRRRSRSTTRRRSARTRSQRRSTCSPTTPTSTAARRARSVRDAAGQRHAWSITGGGTGLTYTPNANYCNTPPGTTPITSPTRSTAARPRRCR